MFVWEDGKVERWKIYLFGWEEKWENEKWSWYKFIIMSTLNNNKKKCLCTFHLKKEKKIAQAKGRWAKKKRKRKH